MCRNCGAIVGAGETQCAVCGASTSSQPTPGPDQRPPDRETIRFARAVLNRPYKFTIVFMVANLFVFLLMWESNGMTSQALSLAFEEPVLIAYGAKVNYLVNAPNYQWWRLIAPMFIHINLLHLLVNMYSLMMVGPFVEKLYGSAKFVVFWVLTGIGGLIASYLTVRPQLATGPIARFIFKSQDFPSAGASGALFGLVGVLFVFGIKFRHELPEGFKRAFGTGLLPIIFINLFIGFVGQGFIDNAAHLGGLFSGAVLALGVSYQRPDVRRTITNAWRVLQILALSIVLVGFYKVARNFSLPVPPTARAVQNANNLIFIHRLHRLR
jgi:rhomboid protease GluP